MRGFFVLLFVLSACSTTSTTTTNHDGGKTDSLDGSVELDGGNNAAFEDRLRRCGDGVVDADELCDPGLFEGCEDEDGACFKCNSRCNQWKMVIANGEPVAACSFDDGRGGRRIVELDGNNRPIKKDIFFSGSATPAGTNTYRYGTTGLLEKNEIDYKPRDGVADAVITYHRDPRGRIVKEERDDPIDGFADRAEVRVYKGELLFIREVDNEADGTSDRRTQYTYDEFGRLEKTEVTSNRETSVENYSYPNESTIKFEAISPMGQLWNEKTITLDEYGNAVEEVEISHNYDPEYEITTKTLREFDEYGNQTSETSDVIDGGSGGHRWTWDYECYQLPTP